MQQTNIVGSKENDFGIGNDVTFRLKEEFLKLLSSMNTSFVLNLQLERYFLKRKIFKKKELIHSLIELCKEGFIEAILPEDIYRDWALFNVDKTTILIRDKNENKDGREDSINDLTNDIAENFTQDALIVPKGSYYTWNYKRGLLNCTKFNDSNKKGNLILDTYNLRHNNPEIFDYSLIKLALMLESNKNINLKLVWVLPEFRNELPL